MAFLDYFPVVRWFLPESISSLPNPIKYSMDTIESGVRWLVAPEQPTFNCTSTEDWQALWESSLNSTNGTKLGETIFQCESELREAASEAWSNTTWFVIAATALLLYSQRNKIYNTASALWGSKTFREQLESYVKKCIVPTIGTALAAYLLSRDPENEDLKRTIQFIQDNWELYCAITAGTGALASTSVSSLIEALKQEGKKQSQGPVSGKDGNEVIGKLQWGFEGSDKTASPEVLLAKTTRYMRLYAERFKDQATSIEDKEAIANGLQAFLVDNIPPTLTNQFGCHSATLKSL